MKGEEDTNFRSEELKGHLFLFSREFIENSISKDMGLLKMQSHSSFMLIKVCESEKTGDKYLL